MELALALMRLWERRIWLAIGVVVAVAAGFGGMVAFKSTVYSSASTQMVVDSPKSALGNMQTSLIPFTNRAVVFARLMVSPEALDYIGQQAGIPGNEIAAQGPAEIGAPQATHNPSAIKDGKIVIPSSKFILRFDQNPELPTVDIYSQAPTTRQAIALANGAVTGFAKYLNILDGETNVPDQQRVQIRQLGSAQGGEVNPSSGKEIAVLLALMMFVVWCFGMLFAIRLRANLRESRAITLGNVPGFDPGLVDHQAAGRLPLDGVDTSARRGFGSDGDGEAELSNGHRPDYATHER